MNLFGSLMEQAGSLQKINWKKHIQLFQVFIILQILRILYKN